MPMPTTSRFPAGSGRKPPYTSLALQIFRPVFHSTTAADPTDETTASVLSPENPCTMPSSAASGAPSSAETTVVLNTPAVPICSASAMSDPSAVPATHRLAAAREHYSTVRMSDAVHTPMYHSTPCTL